MKKIPRLTEVFRVDEIDWTKFPTSKDPAHPMDKKKAKQQVSSQGTTVGTVPKGPPDGKAWYVVNWIGDYVEPYDGGPPLDADGKPVDDWSIFEFSADKDEDDVIRDLDSAVQSGASGQKTSPGDVPEKVAHQAGGIHIWSSK